MIKRIVIKIGASLLYGSKNELDNAFIDDLVSQVVKLTAEGKEVILVSSGAIAMGMAILKLHARPKELALAQAASAIGQHELMHVYRRAFEAKGTSCAQLLLTWEDFDNRQRYLNAKSTISTLLGLKSIPVINENDTVSTDEIKFGDNDRLSALASTLIGADLLIILSDVEGLLAADKKTLVPLVEKITPAIKALAGCTSKQRCVGGMITKIEAAQICAGSGIPCVVAGGRIKDVLLHSVHQPGSRGTLFLPKGVQLAAKERWIAFSARKKGEIIVDDGAKAALLNKKSLLCVGVSGVKGNFAAGDIVSIAGKDDKEFAKGKVRLSSRELEKVMGSRQDKEVIHRDNIVILEKG